MAFTRPPRRWVAWATIVALALVFCLCYSGYGPNIGSNVGFQTQSYYSDDVPEIYGLLGIVVPSPSSPQAHHEILLPSQHAEVLVDGPGKGSRKTNLAYGIYDTNPGVPTDWKLRREEIDHDHPIIIFGKSYCPYTKRLMNLLASLPIDPPPHIVQIDLRDDTSLIQDLLLRLTGRRTVPNMIVHGTSIGGSDDVHALATKATKEFTAEQGGRLREILREAGVRWGSPNSRVGGKNKFVRPRNKEDRVWIAKQH